jgi:hypothetical protein
LPKGYPEGNCDGTGFALCNNGFDTPGKVLGHLLTNIPETGIEELNERDPKWKKKGVFRKFRQSEFVNDKDFSKSEYQEFGYVFYPD